MVTTSKKRSRISRENGNEATRTQERTRIRKEKGQCTRHEGILAEPGKTMCRPCLDMLRKGKNNLKAQGLCPNHPNEHVIPGKTKCHLCVKYEKSQREKRKSEGKCVNHPSRLAYPGYTTCLSCVENKSWWEIKNNYNFTKQEYINECEIRNYLCDICKVLCRPILIKNEEIKEQFCVDHDHKTGKVRGFLCHTCNVIIGFFNEDIERIKIFNDNAINYLILHKTIKE